MRRLLITIAACAAFATVASAQQLTKVRVAYDEVSMTAAPLIYADKFGIFKKFGLDVSLSFIDGGPMLTEALTGKTVDIAENAYAPAVSAAIEGEDVVIIGGISNKLPFQLVVKKAIKKAADLKGQSIAISRSGAPTDTAAAFAVSRLGLSRGDVKILQLGGTAARIAAAMSGQIAGTMEQYPDTAELSRSGFHVLVDVTDIAGEYPNTSYATRRSYLKSHPDVVKAFLEAIATAVHEYKTNPKAAIAITQAFLNVKDPANAKAAYDAYVRIYPDNLRPSLQGLQFAIDELAHKNPKAKAVKPQQLVDTSILDAIEKEGFFKRFVRK